MSKNLDGPIMKNGEIVSKTKPEDKEKLKKIVGLFSGGNKGDVIPELKIEEPIADVREENENSIVFDDDICKKTRKGKREGKLEPEGTMLKRPKTRVRQEPIRVTDESRIELETMKSRIIEEIAPTINKEGTKTEELPNDTTENVKGLLPVHEETIPDRSLKEAQAALALARKQGRPQEEIEKWEQICKNLYREQKLDKTRTRIEPSLDSPILLGSTIDFKTIDSNQITELEERMDELKERELMSFLKSLINPLIQYVDYLKGALTEFDSDQLKQELLRLSSVSNALDQRIEGLPIGRIGSGIYNEIKNLQALYGEFKDKTKDKKPEKLSEAQQPIDTTLKTETTAEKEKLTWEEAIDSWIKEKINHEMDKVERRLEKEKKKGSYEEIYSQAVESLKEKFKKTIPYAFRNFAVHNVAWSNQETDLDGKVCLGLLGLAGWSDTKKGSISYINPDKRSKNKVHMDVGQYNGVGILTEVENELQVLDLNDKEAIKLERKDKNPLFNMGMIIDHHPDGAPSAAGMMFGLLDKLRMFENNKKIKHNDIEAIPRMIEFIDLIDSQGYQEIGKPENWSKSDKTILGLHRFMDFPELLKFFREDGGYNRELTEEELKKYNLIRETKENGRNRKINRQEQQRKVIDVSGEKLREFEQKGFIIETKFGKTIIDVKGELPGGAFVAQSVGASYLKWDATGKSFFMFSDKELDENLFDVGLRIRKHLWVVPRTETSEKLNLRDILNKIEAKVLPGSELEKYLLESDNKKEPEKTETKIEVEVKIETGEKKPEEPAEPTKAPTESEKESRESLSQKIERKKKEIEDAETRASIYRPAGGLFRRKPVVRDLGYYGAVSELERLKGELRELQEYGQQEKMDKVVEKVRIDTAASKEIPKEVPAPEGIESVVVRNPKIEKLSNKLSEIDKDLKLWSQDINRYEISRPKYQRKIRQAEKKKLKLEKKILKLGGRK